MTSDDINSGGLDRTGRELRDLQDELAGRETGRPTRFFAAAAGGGARGEEKDKQKDKQLSALMRLLASDPVYAERYREVDAKLREAEEATVTVLMILTERLEAAQDNLEEMKAGAATMADGTRVYRTSDGERAYTEDGRLLTRAEMESIEWPEDAPSWEEFQAQERRLQQLETERQKVLRYQEDVLDPARRQMDDEDNPPSREELDQVEKGIADAKPQSVRRFEREGESFQLDDPDASGSAAPATPGEKAPNLDLPPLPTSGGGPLDP